MIYKRIITLIIVLVLVCYSSAWSKNYFVDASGGNDSWSGLSPMYDGGIGGPWKTLNQISKFCFSPGDTVLLKSGEVWREQLIIPSLGSYQEPITFTSYGEGPKPVILPSKFFSSGTAWTGPDDNGEYYLTIGTKEEFPYACTNAVRGNPIGISTYSRVEWGRKR
ncbi:MAG: hypothetical protein ABIN58_09135 [candidate division WOR-3 bacterium]